MRTIYFEPLGYIREMDKLLLEDPPAGYRFILSGLAASKSLRSLTWRNGGLIPYGLIWSMVASLRTRPSGALFTYASHHLVLRRETWVLELICEQPYLLVGPEFWWKLLRPLVVGTLGSARCKAIICSAEAVKHALMQLLSAEDKGVQRRIREKLHVVYRASFPRSRMFDKPADGKVRLLFVNSAHLNHPATFFGKGGLLVLEAFRRLRPRYHGLELYLRSPIPTEVGRQYSDVLGDARIFERPMPREELERLYMLADIFVLPAFVTPDAVLIEAMSFGLPIVSTEVWATPEFVVDGWNGYLVRSSDLTRYTEGWLVHLNQSGWTRHVRTLYGSIVDQLVERLAVLIDDPGLRREMGERGWYEVEEGRLSMRHRNEKLGAIFAELDHASRRDR